MIDERPEARELPTEQDMERAADYLRAAQLAREWLMTADALRTERASPFRCFVLGYLAAVRDRT